MVLMESLCNWVDDATTRPRSGYQHMSEVIVEEWSTYPDTWIVEAVDPAGEIHQTVFMGQGAEARARKYAATEYGHH